MRVVGQYEDKSTMESINDKFALSLIDFWRKWYKGETLGDSPEWMHLADISKKTPIEALALVSAVVKQDTEGVTFLCLSDCVTDMLRLHGATIITILESEAASSPRFATMLSYVTPDHIPDELCGRLLSIAVADPTPRGDVRVIVAGGGRVVIGSNRRSLFAIVCSSIGDKIREWFSR
jgi:hypothetical protein